MVCIHRHFHLWLFESKAENVLRESRASFLNVSTIVYMDGSKIKFQQKKRMSIATDKRYRSMHLCAKNGPY